MYEITAAKVEEAGHTITQYVALEEDLNMDFSFKTDHTPKQLSPLHYEYKQGGYCIAFSFCSTFVHLVFRRTTANTL